MYYDILGVESCASSCTTPANNNNINPSYFQNPNQQPIMFMNRTNPTNTNGPLTRRLLPQSLSSSAIATSTAMKTSPQPQALISQTSVNNNIVGRRYSAEPLLGSTTTHDIYNNPEIENRQAYNINYNRTSNYSNPQIRSPKKQTFMNNVRPGSAPRFRQPATNTGIEPLPLRNATQPANNIYDIRRGLTAKSCDLMQNSLFNAGYFKPGMKEVPNWLKGLRLHKYTALFQMMSYAEMMAVDDAKLEALQVTAGARKKILQSLDKLRERFQILIKLENEGLNGKANVQNIINELRIILGTPINCCNQENVYNSINSSQNADQREEDLLTFYISRVLTHLHQHLFQMSGDTDSLLFVDKIKLEEDYIVKLYQIYDRIINHEAFNTTQKQELFIFRQILQNYAQGRRISFNRQFGNASMNSYIKTNNRSGAAQTYLPPPLASSQKLPETGKSFRARKNYIPAPIKSYAKYSQGLLPSPNYLVSTTSKMVVDQNGCLSNANYEMPFIQQQNNFVNYNTNYEQAQNYPNNAYSNRSGSTSSPTSSNPSPPLTQADIKKSWDAVPNILLKDSTHTYKCNVNEPATINPPQIQGLIKVHQDQQLNTTSIENVQQLFNELNINHEQQHQNNNQQKPNVDSFQIQQWLDQSQPEPQKSNFDQQEKCQTSNLAYSQLVFKMLQALPELRQLLLEKNAKMPSQNHIATQTTHVDPHKTAAAQSMFYSTNTNDQQQKPLNNTYNSFNYQNMSRTNQPLTTEEKMQFLNECMSQSQQYKQNHNNQIPMSNQFLPTTKLSPAIKNSTVNQLWWANIMNSSSEQSVDPKKPMTNATTQIDNPLQHQKMPTVTTGKLGDLEIPSAHSYYFDYWNPLSTTETNDQNKIPKNTVSTQISPTTNTLNVPTIAKQQQATCGGTSSGYSSGCSDRSGSSPGPIVFNFDTNPLTSFESSRQENIANTTAPNCFNDWSNNYEKLTNYNRTNESYLIQNGFLNDNQQTSNLFYNNTGIPHYQNNVFNPVDSALTSPSLASAAPINQASQLYWEMKAVH